MDDIFYEKTLYRILRGRLRYKLGDLVLYIYEPSAELIEESYDIYDEAHRKAYLSGSYIKEELIELLMKYELWSPFDDREADKIDKQIEELEDKIFSKYDSIYDAAFDVARNGIEVIDSLKLPKKTADAFVDVSSKIKMPSVEIRGVLEITDSSHSGVENIKKSLHGFEENNQKDKVNVLYIGAPKYRISVISSDFKSAENTLKPILETIQKTTEKNKGTFKFTREGSKKTGEG